MVIFKLYLIKFLKNYNKILNYLEKSQITLSFVDVIAEQPKLLEVKTGMDCVEFLS